MCGSNGSPNNVLGHRASEAARSTAGHSDSASVGAVTISEQGMPSTKIVRTLLLQL